MRSPHPVALAFVLSSVLIVGTSTAVAQEWLSGPWSQGIFGTPGIGGTTGPVVVNAMTVYDVDGAGPEAPSLFFAGNFQDAGGDAVSNIARWRDRRWQPPLGGGVRGEVTGLVTFTPTVGPFMGTPLLLAGGNFPERVAYWSGTAWAAITGGPTFQVFALHVGANSGLLYVAEDYPNKADFSNRIWSFDGATWTLLGTTGGFPGRVHTICESLDDSLVTWLFVGGDFGGVNGVPAINLAGLPFGGSWTSQGPFDIFDGPVRAITTYNDGTGSMLYVGGDFSNPNPPLFVQAGVVRYNYTLPMPAWEMVAGGLRDTVRALYTYVPPLGGPSLLIAAGDFFTTPGDSQSSRIAAFDGSTWSPVADGIGSGSVHSLCQFTDTYGSELYAGGTFETNGAEPFHNHLHNVARLSNGLWRALGGGFGIPIASPTELVLTLAGTLPEDVPSPFLKPVLYAGGHFLFAGGLRVNKVARWIDNQWESMNDGIAVAGYVTSMVMHDDGTGKKLYAAGSFSVVGGVTAEKIARWDENLQIWEPVGAGLLGMGANVSLAVYDANDALGPNLYAAGDNNEVRRWNGLVWIGLPDVQLSPPIQLKVVGPPKEQTLLCSGAYLDGRIAVRWTGTDWTGIGDALGGTSCLEAFGSLDAPFDDCRLFAGGAVIQDVEASGAFSKFDTFTWIKPPHNIAGEVKAMQLVSVLGSPLLVLAGTFSMAFVDPLGSNVALWDGLVWNPLAGGVTGTTGAESILVFDDEIFGPHVYVTGMFTEAAGASSKGIARFSLGSSLETATCPPKLIPPGDTFGVPFVVLINIPITTSTLYYNNDYDPPCASSESDSPDVVYQFNLAASKTVNVSLCGSEFDTRLYVYGSDYNSSPIACNDDACGTGGTRSAISNLSLGAGTYYIVVDGANDESGHYTLSVTEVTACPCVTTADCRNTLCASDNACNHATCNAGVCVFTCERYGDVQPAGGNSIVNLDDFLCELSGFASLASCPNADINPCGGNGVVNLDDILAVLGAFAGANPCGCTETSAPGTGVTPLCGSNQP